MAATAACADPALCVLAGDVELSRGGARPACLAVGWRHRGCGDTGNRVFADVRFSKSAPAVCGVGRSHVGIAGTACHPWTDAFVATARQEVDSVFCRLLSHCQRRLSQPRVGFRFKRFRRLEGARRPGVAPGRCRAWCHRRGPMAVAPAWACDGFTTTRRRGFRRSKRLKPPDLTLIILERGAFSVDLNKSRGEGICIQLVHGDEDSRRPA